MKFATLLTVYMSRTPFPFRNYNVLNNLKVNKDINGIIA